MPLIKFTQASRSTLQVGITAAESTSIVLKKLVDIYGTALAFTDFTTKVYLTIEPGSDNEEIISCAGFTVNSDGTVTLDTTIIRGLAAKSPYGATGTARSHAAGVVVIISNNPQFYDAIMDFVVNLEDAQTIAGKKTFTTVPDTASAPLAGNDLANKTYVDAAGIGAATSVQIIVTGDAGEVIADGDLIYFDTITNNEWMLCDADIATTVENVQLGIAQGAGTNGAAITNGILLRGIDDAQSGLVAGNIMYASNTAGGISTTPGTTEVTIGIVPAGETTKIYFSPRFNQMITENQQDALAGDNTDIAVGLGNKFVTQTGLQDGAEIYAADAEASDIYVITLSPVPTALETGMVVNFKANTANTGAATLNVNSLGAKTIKKLHDVDLATGDIEAGQIMSVVYDGINFQMQSQIAQFSSSSKMLSTYAGATVTTTTTETNLFSVSVPANTLGTGNAIKGRVFISAFETQPAGGNQSITYRLKYGATTIGTATITGSSVTGNNGYIEFVLSANGATNSQLMSGQIRIQPTAITIAAPGNMAFTNISGSAAEDSTGALTFVLTAQPSVSVSTLNTSILSGIIEIVSVE